MTWTEENGSSARVGRRDTSSLVSVSRACLSVSLQTTTSFCLGLQGLTTGKVWSLNDQRVIVQNKHKEFSRSPG